MPQSPDKELLGVGCFSVPPNAKKYLLDVLKTKRLSYGPYLKRFEREFAKGHGAQFGIVVNSGTSALRIAVACLKECGKWAHGDEVIIPAVTFVSDVNVLTQNNLKPVFVDIDPRTYNIDPAKIVEKIGPRTKAIMLSHLFGQPAEMDAIMTIAKKYKLKVIEDSCETMYANYKGKSVGSFGDIACFSTYVAHLIVTGVGGIAVTNNKKYAEVMRSLANHGRDGIYISIDDAKEKKGKELAEVISRRFSFVRPGYSFRLTEFEGALGCAQLEAAPPTFLKRKKNALYLREKLMHLEKYIQLPYFSEHADHVFMMFPIVIKKGVKIKKSTIVNFLEEHMVETRDMLPLIIHPMVKKQHGVKKGHYPVADWVNANGFYIGCHQEMRKVELDHIIATFSKFFDTAFSSTK
jgi:dTDP-4-amino-4,6-dideoxygalactose transaminase